MENQAKSECRCEKSSCGCAGTAVQPCTCGEKCACTRTCRCGAGCNCAAKK